MGCWLGRKGVCRDYTHLAIAFCRALSIPARYVGGYAAGLERWISTRVSRPGWAASGGSSTRRITFGRAHRRHLARRRDERRAHDDLRENRRRAREGDVHGGAPASAAG